MDRKLYFKVYQDIYSIGERCFIETPEYIMKDLKVQVEELEDYDALPPCIVPVLMTEDEFKELEDFKGY